MLRSVFLTICMLMTVQGELYSALGDMKQILHTERAVAHDLKEYIQREESRLAKLQKLADDFEKHSTEALSDVERHLSNPVNAYLLIKRFTADWNQIIETEIRSNATEELLLSLWSKTGSFPDQEDLVGAAIALMRLQDTYALSASKIANGELQGVKDSPRLTEKDCFTLGKIAFDKGDFYHSIIWMQEALDIAPDQDQDARSALLEYTAYSYYRQGNLWHALNCTAELLRLDPSNIRARNNKEAFEKELRAREYRWGGKYTEDEKNLRPNPRRLEGHSASDTFANYERLCRGEETQVREDLHLLTCQYRRHHPYFYIRPAREEVMNLNPRILVYHDLFSNEEIDRIKELAAPKLSRSRVFQDDSRPPAATIQDFRVSKSGWLNDTEDPSISRFSRRTSFITNLSLETAEQLQVAHYGIGGHYQTHYDFALGTEVKYAFNPLDGNRIATLLCYLSDVGAGGGTVFPSIGLLLLPRKGSCAFWYNLSTGGDGDMKTDHAACPVLSGFKWVGNKWFHERGQEFIRPCSLSS